MSQKTVFFLTTACSISGILLCQALEKESDCKITIFGIDEEAEVQRYLGDEVECFIISLESPKDMEGIKSFYKKWRSAWPAMPMIFLIPDTNFEYEFIKDGRNDLNHVFEGEYQRFGDLVKIIRKVLAQS